jgi:WD40 repeat protein
VAATGDGFAVYHIATGKEAARVRVAHGAAVSRVLLLGGGKEPCVVTSSGDASIKIWDVAKACAAVEPPPAPHHQPHEPFIVEFARKIAPSSSSSPKSRRSAKFQPLVGVLRGHTSSINDLIETDGYGFASCASDHTVISWRNACSEWQQLNDATIEAVRYYCADD